MSGGAKGAKQPLGRPLDGGVGRSRYAEFQDIARSRMVLLHTPIVGDAAL